MAEKVGREVRENPFSNSTRRTGWQRRETDAERKVAKGKDRPLKKTAIIMSGSGGVKYASLKWSRGKSVTQGRKGEDALGVLR